MTTACDKSARTSSAGLWVTWHPSLPREPLALWTDSTTEYYVRGAEPKDRSAPRGATVRRTAFHDDHEACPAVLRDFVAAGAAPVYHEWETAGPGPVIFT
ncbi:hypothetical protein Kpho01_63850 [Kitasatospora phosalacinea]|uniref:Uncharacterized protein n=1 Tax=Kitasatospora phosalacinea TaxID=2065 RepID=A0A9W6PL67_9ACTN|nr:hypothetical protein Kpho01_63850 [Kitasatospora phosalacinea]